MAPVKDPFLWPNNSLSRRSFGIAPQFTGIKGLFFLDDASCKALAVRSLPVPLSPKMSVVESLFPIVSIKFLKETAS